jgi:hypothetical protein
MKKISGELCSLIDAGGIPIKFNFTLPTSSKRIKISNSVRVSIAVCELAAALSHGH